MQNYSEEQIKDIKEREAKCLKFLKEHQMTPAVTMQLVSLGDDTFGIKPIPYLSDFKFTSQPSPFPNGAG